MRQVQVPNSDDFRRIMGIPRRDLDLSRGEALADELTEALLLPGMKGRLYPEQAIALCDMAGQPDGVGALLWLPVGTGKTLLSYLAAVLYGALRPLLFTEASLIAQTWAEFAKFQRTWLSPKGPFTIMSQSLLSRVGHEDDLHAIAPDLILIDEADSWSNYASSAVRRMHRHVSEDKAVRVVAMSGTPQRNSVLDTWHLMRWCLRDQAPVYTLRQDMAALASAVDNKTRQVIRPDPGPWGDTIEEARQTLRDRWLSTPGIVAIDKDSCDAPLSIAMVKSKEDPAIDAAFDDLLMRNVNPRGIDVTTPLQRYQLELQLGCGLCSYYDPEPSAEWREARRESARVVREKILYSSWGRVHYDTELQVFRAFPNDPAVREWMRIRKSFDPVKSSRFEWISDSALESAAEWLESDPSPGVVWCGHVEFSVRLARLLGLEYYSRSGESLNGVKLHEAPKGRPMVVSWKANKKGFNLQDWNRSLLVAPPASAKWIEQIFGRHHRRNQTQAVRAQVLATSGGVQDMLLATLAEAGFNKDTLSLTQKVLRAKIEYTEPVRTSSNTNRWARKVE